MGSEMCIRDSTDPACQTPRSSQPSWAGDAVAVERASILLRPWHHRAAVVAPLRASAAQSSQWTQSGAFEMTAHLVEISHAVKNPRVRSMCTKECSTACVSQTSQASVLAVGVNNGKSRRQTPRNTLQTSQNYVPMVCPRNAFVPCPRCAWHRAVAAARPATATQDQVASVAASHWPTASHPESFQTSALALQASVADDGRCEAD